MIEIGRRNYLIYLVLPQPLKTRLLTLESRARLDRINALANGETFSGEAAAQYDRLHRYGGPEQTEYPAEVLATEVWPREGYGRAVELGAGGGHFTALIARRARAVVAVEPVPDLQRAIELRCRREGLSNVEILGATALEINRHLGRASIDSAFMIHSLHHFHRRPEVFAALARVVRPGGRLFVVEPHHNIRRVVRLVRKYLTIYRPRGLWRQELKWGTHDFLTIGELRSLCRGSGFGEVRISGYWLPGVRRTLGDDQRRRCRVERELGRVPGLRHFAAELSLEARRTQDCARAPYLPGPPGDRAAQVEQGNRVFFIGGFKP